MPVAILEGGSQTMVHIGGVTQGAGRGRGIVEVAETVRGLRRDVDRKGLAVAHAPLDGLEVGIVPVTAIGLAEPVAIVRAAAGKEHHVAGPFIVVDPGDGGPGRIIVIDVPARGGSLAVFIEDRAGNRGGVVWIGPLAPLNTIGKGVVVRIRIKLGFTGCGTRLAAKPCLVGVGGRGHFWRVPT